MIHPVKLEGQGAIGFACSGRARALLGRKKGEADLCLVDGCWYLYVACEIDAPEPTEVDRSRLPAVRSKHSLLIRRRLDVSFFPPSPAFTAGE
jgi:hypothetical protein